MPIENRLLYFTGLNLTSGRAHGHLSDTMMQALNIDSGRLELSDLTLPQSHAEALVRVLKSGICGTDLELVKGYAGFRGTPGHEFVGIVESSDDRPDLAGKRVVGEINVGCGTCGICSTGDERHCPRRSVLGIVNRNGAHAEFLTLPSRNLLEVPDNVSDDEAVFVEPLAAAVGINERLQFDEGNNVAVIGDGKLGIFCARALHTTPPVKDVTLIGKHIEKMQLAAKCGIETVDSKDAAKLSGRFDVIVEASGSESGFASAIDLVKAKGTIVMKSTFHGMQRWEASKVVVNEIKVVGSRCGRFKPALNLLSSNQIEVADLISEEFSLSDGIRAYSTAAAQGMMKVLLKM